MTTFPIPFSLDLPQVVTELRRIARDFPDRVGSDANGQCQYFTLTDNDPVPLCIVGELLHRQGIVIHPGTDQVQNMVQVGELDAEWEDERVKDLLAYVQSQQDDGCRWQSAVDIGIDDFIRYHPEARADVAAADEVAS